MTELKIKHITNDDIQGVVTPCYITSQGECYQFNKKLNKIVKKALYYDKQCNSNKIVINKQGGKCTTMILATTVYRYFSGETNLPKNISIGHKDGNQLNCCIDNLIRERQKRKSSKRLPYKKRKIEQKSVNLAEITKKKKKDSLTLTEFSSFLALFSLMQRYKPLEITPNEVILDTKYLSPEELNRLKKMKLDERVKII